MELTLQHAKQPWPWGCQQYSLYSLVGDARVLATVGEDSSQRFDLAALGLGYFLNTLWTDVRMQQAATPAWWHETFGAEESGPNVGCVIPLLVAIDSLKYAGSFHSVAVALRIEPGLPVTVFDPGTDAAQEFASLDHFLASPYGRCYEVKQVGDADPNYYKSWPGPEGKHVTPEVRAAWEAHQATTH